LTPAEVLVVSPLRSFGEPVAHGSNGLLTSLGQGRTPLLLTHSSYSICVPGPELFAIFNRDGLSRQTSRWMSIVTDAGCPTDQCWVGTVWLSHTAAHFRSRVVYTHCKCGRRWRCVFFPLTISLRYRAGIADWWLSVAPLTYIVSLQHANISGAPYQYADALVFFWPGMWSLSTSGRICYVAILLGGLAGAALWLASTHNPTHSFWRISASVLACNVFDSRHCSSRIEIGHYCCRISSPGTIKSNIGTRACSERLIPVLTHQQTVSQSLSHLGGAVLG